MTSTQVACGALLLFVFALVWSMVRENNKRKKKFLEKIKKSWGAVPTREYSWDELEQISAYHKAQPKNSFVIDEITWNDLDMDRIFMLMNQTVSSAGEDYLYAMLHRPEFSEERLKERERLFCFFEKEEKTRIRCQQILTTLRKPRGLSLYQSIHVEKDCQVGSPIREILSCVLFFASLVAFMVVPAYGVFAFLAVSGINIITYLKGKEEINRYLGGFRSVMQLIGCADTLEKAGISELSEYTKRLKDCKKALGSFRKGSFLVVNHDGMETGPEAVMLDYIRMMTHIDLIKFNSMMKAMREHQKEIEEMIEIFGLLDACISIASFRELLPYYCSPKFDSDKKRAVLDVENLYHPLILEPVANSIKTTKAVLVTGSNASGKSTFLKMVAINAILAQTIHTCMATECKMSYFRVMTSMALRDDLESKESYYIVEIKSLKRILDSAKEETPLLCIVDEVLRGTNTIERIAASSEILASLCLPHVLSFAATHDIELTYMLEEYYTNYHFEEEVKEDDVKFNYLLKKGRVTTRNAIRLLKMTGYDDSIVEASKNAVVRFEQEGSWKKVGEN
ncbi:DNA mismatch repair protein MutS [Firmicutes bacterium OM04-13BH]|nr:DNA mismatch repair protein MutS [Firmicutes bacterium AM10-47]RHV47763.1 DNA mismatch repair protein MutS [Firmicutes bacterium OM04-13BH]